jgi:hypothetical protein
MAVRNLEQQKKAKSAKELAIQLARLSVVSHFDEAYGKDVSKIEAWQQLCRDVEVEVGPSIPQCKKVIHSPAIYPYLEVWF